MDNPTKNTPTKLLTVEDVKQALPSKAKSVTQEALDIINSSISDPLFQNQDLLKTASLYENVLKGTRASIVEYLNAIRFVALITDDEEAGYTWAYAKVFMNREFVSSRASLPTDSPKYCELTSAASRYRKSKLVVDILTISQVPLDIMFSGGRYKCLGILLDIAENGKFDRDRVSAAKELLAATKNENTKIELEIGPSAGAISMQEQLDKQLTELAHNQQMLLAAGHSITDVQKTNLSLDIIEGTLDE